MSLGIAGTTGRPAGWADSPFEAPPRRGGPEYPRQRVSPGVLRRDSRYPENHTVRLPPVLARVGVVGAAGGVARGSAGPVPTTPRRSRPS